MKRQQRCKTFHVKTQDTRTRSVKNETKTTARAIPASSAKSYTTGLPSVMAAKVLRMELSLPAASETISNNHTRSSKKCLHVENIPVTLERLHSFRPVRLPRRCRPAGGTRGGDRFKQPQGLITVLGKFPSTLTLLRAKRNLNKQDETSNQVMGILVA